MLESEAGSGDEGEESEESDDGSGQSRPGARRKRIGEAKGSK